MSCRESVYSTYTVWKKSGNIMYLLYKIVWCACRLESILLIHFQNSIIPHFHYLPVQHYHQYQARSQGEGVGAVRYLPAIKGPLSRRLFARGGIILMQYLYCLESFLVVAVSCSLYSLLSVVALSHTVLTATKTMQLLKPSSCHQIYYFTNRCFP